MTDKDKKIIADAQINDTPIFVLSAKDSLSIQSLKHYLVNCAYAFCNQSHVKAIAARIDEFEKWQSENMNNVKLPD